MVVAVAFSCVRANRVAVRGIVFCPQKQSRLLLSRLRACGHEPLDDSSVEEGRTGRDWVQKHFHFVDTSPPGVEFSPFTLKRYFAFARIANAVVCEQGIGVSFDVFLGPGELAISADNGNEAY